MRRDRSQLLLLRWRRLGIEAERQNQRQDPLEVLRNFSRMS